MPKKKLVNHVDKNGIISKVMIEIPDDQDEEGKEVSQEEFTTNQPITRKEFIGVLNKTYGDINNLLAKVNEVETKIKSLENVIIDHNNLLKNIVNLISK
jgi:hypothetical protein